MRVTQATTCSQSEPNPNLVQEENKDDQEQDVRRGTSEVDDPQESKDAESEESKHADVEEADETGTEKDAASSTNPANEPEAEGDEEQELANEASQVTKNTSVSQKEDAQEDQKVENGPETNQAVAPGKAEEGTAQSTASEESQLGTQPSDDAKDKNESAPTTAALNTNLFQEQKEEDPDGDVHKAEETRTEEVQAIAESKSATKQVSATANRQNETRQESKLAQSSAGT